MSERIPYYLDGESLGTCLPVNAHKFEVWLEWEGARGHVVCPDELGCTIESSGKRPGCWLADWWDEVGWEMYGLIGESLLVATLPLEGNATDDGPIIWAVTPPGGHPVEPTASFSRATRLDRADTPNAAGVSLSPSQPQSLKEKVKRE